MTNPKQPDSAAVRLHRLESALAFIDDKAASIIWAAVQRLGPLELRTHALPDIFKLATELGWRDPGSPAGEELDGWIACAERMPESGDWVLAHRPGHHMRMFQWTGWAWRKESGEKPSHALLYTHWKPLPAPPRVDPEVES